MGGRYCISGVQIALLLALDKKERAKLLQDIQDNQFIGDTQNSIEEDCKRLEGQIG